MPLVRPLGLAAPISARLTALTETKLCGGGMSAQTSRPLTNDVQKKAVSVFPSSKRS